MGGASRAGNLRQRGWSGISAASRTLWNKWTRGSSMSLRCFCHRPQEGFFLALPRRLRRCDKVVCPRGTLCRLHLWGATGNPGCQRGRGKRREFLPSLRVRRFSGRRLAGHASRQKRWETTTRKAGATGQKKRTEKDATQDCKRWRRESALVTVSAHKEGKKPKGAPQTAQ